MTATGYTQSEIIAMLADDDPDAPCTAIQWLEAETEESIDEGAYTLESIAAAVVAGDPGLLEEC